MTCCLSRISCCVRSFLESAIRRGECVQPAPVSLGRLGRQGAAIDEVFDRHRIIVTSPTPSIGDGHDKVSQVVHVFRARAGRLLWRHPVDDLGTSPGGPETQALQRKHLSCSAPTAASPHWPRTTTSRTRRLSRRGQGVDPGFHLVRARLRRDRALARLGRVPGLAHLLPAVHAAAWSGRPRWSAASCA